MMQEKLRAEPAFWPKASLAAKLYLMEAGLEVADGRQARMMGF
jgi:hypothetical protein